MHVKLTNAQYQVANDPHRYKIICAGRRFGKSTLSRLLIYKMALEKPGLYWIVSPTYTQSHQNHWRELIKEVPVHWIAGKYEGKSLTLKTRESEDLRKLLADQGVSATNIEPRVRHLYSIIELKGADDPDSLRGIKLRGLIVDEIASIRYWTWLWEEVLSATLMDYEAPAIFIGTPKGYNHFYDLFKLGQQGVTDFKSWQFTSYDNPHINPQEIDKKKETLDPDVFAAEYLAEFKRYTGLVYKDFDRLIHVKDIPLTEFEPIYFLRGLDRGYTNPTAVPIIAVNKKGEWYQTHELYKKGLTTNMLVDELRNLDMIAQVPEFEYETMDSAAAGDIAELNDMGYSFIPVSKTSGESNMNYVRFKVQKWSDRLRNKTYFVHPRCVETIREHESYAWPEKKNELSNDSEQPEKLNDHMMDALGDLNVMYTHYYVEKAKHPWDGKLPGTYVRPSVRDEDENNWEVSLYE